MSEEQSQQQVEAEGQGAQETIHMVMEHTTYVAEEAGSITDVYRVWDEPLPMTVVGIEDSLQGWARATQSLPGLRM